jgi:prefoldin subunit 5
VVVQDTGFDAVLPLGEGLLAFKTLEEAVASIKDIEANYPRHAKAAREIAAEYFDATKVLPRLVEESMNGRD